MATACWAAIKDPASNFSARDAASQLAQHCTAWAAGVRGWVVTNLGREKISEADWETNTEIDSQESEEYINNSFEDETLFLKSRTRRSTGKTLKRINSAVDNESAQPPPELEEPLGAGKPKPERRFAVDVSAQETGKLRRHVANPLSGRHCVETIVEKDAYLSDLRPSCSDLKAVKERRRRAELELHLQRGMHTDYREWSEATQLYEEKQSTAFLRHVQAIDATGKAMPQHLLGQHPELRFANSRPKRDQPREGSRSPNKDHDSRRIHNDLDLAGVAQGLLQQRGRPGTQVLTTAGVYKR